MWKCLLFVFLGSGIGGALRWLVAVGMQNLASDGREWMMPWSTLFVNIAGCFVFGLVFALGVHGTIGREWKLALTTGFCGGLTTFSTFSYETLSMLSGGQIWHAFAYALVSLSAGILAAGAGYMLAR